MKNLYKDHGTKLIGTLGTVASVLGAADPEAIASLLGPSGVSYVAGFLSILTIIRGFQNSKQQPK